MDYRIRRSMVSDAHRIFLLSRNVMHYEFSEEQVEQSLRKLIGSKSNLLLVAVDRDDEVIGFIQASAHDPVYAPPMKSIVALAVDPDFRKKGIATSLLNAVEDWARKDGAAGVRINSPINEKEASLFYKAHGYEYKSTKYNYRKMF